MSRVKYWFYPPEQPVEYHPVPIEDLEEYVKNNLSKHENPEVGNFYVGGYDVGIKGLLNHFKEKYKK
ncbi:MAG: hypothetical protein ACOC33_02900 [bacterium]